MVLLIGTLLSFSLAAYGLLVGAILIILYQYRKYLWISVLLSMYLGVGLFSITYNDGDNVLNMAIVSRLEMTDEGEIAGSNRTSMAFDSTYEKFLRSNEIWTGVGSKAFGVRGDGSDNVTIGCASYKRYFFLRGIIGSSLIVIFLILYCFYYHSSWSWGFLIIYVVANLIRDYPTMEMWMYLYLLAIPYLSNIQKQRLNIV